MHQHPRPRFTYLGHATVRCDLPGVLITGALGFFVVTLFQYSFALGWIQSSIVLYVLVLAVILYQALHFNRAVLEGAVALRGGNSAEFDRLALAKWPAMLTHLMALAIVVMIILMAMKPTLH